MQIKQQALEALRKQTLPVEQWMAETQVPGATAAVIRAGELVFHGAWGVRDEYGVPMTEGVLFECASLTKSLFALLAMREAELGRIRLDEPIAAQLRGEPWSEDPRYFRLTPRQTLCHASGLPNWEAKPMHMLFDPGEGFSYSGEGYFLLQRLVEQAEGKDMDELFRAHFFLPYGMESSRACWSPAVGAAFARGFGRDGQIVKRRDSRRTGGNAPEPNAAWSLYSYAADYARFVCRLITERGGLSREGFAEMTAIQISADENIGWGLGFGIVKAEPSVLWHWGDNDGFKSIQIWDKVSGDGAVITTNSDNGPELYFRLLEALTGAEFFGDIRRFIDSAE